MTHSAGPGPSPSVRRNENPVSASTTSSSTTTHRFSTLLGSTLETIVHQLLHSRSIYPPDSFVLHRHLGVRCHASRVPQVCEYVAETLGVAVPAICRGVADALILVILEDETVESAGDATTEESGQRSTSSSRKRRSPCGERTGATKTLERFEFRFHLDPVVDPPKRERKDDDKGCSSTSTDHRFSNEDYAAKRMMDGDNDDSEDSHRYRRRRSEALRLDEGEARANLELSMRECVLRVLALRGRRRRAGNDQKI